MANYPSVPIIEGFEQIERNGRQVDDAADGLGRIRILFDDRFEFTVPHPVSRVHHETIMDFYASNRTGSFNFTSPEDGVTYTVAFMARPKPRLMNGGLRTIVSRLIQTA